MGAEPNQGMYSFSRELTGRWSAQRPLGSPTTYDTQPAFVFSIDTPQGAQYFYVGDRWNPSEFYRDARYMVLPLYFPDDTSIDMRWCDGFTFDPANGTLQEEVRETGLSRIKSLSLIHIFPAGQPEYRAGGYRYCGGRAGQAADFRHGGCVGHLF